METMNQKEAKRQKNNVKKWRKNSGLKRYRERYEKLKNAGFTSYEANKLKYHNDIEIQNLINDRG